MPAKIEPLLYLFLAAQASNCYHGPWLLQCFGHIQSKHEDAKSEVVSFKYRRKVQPIQIMPGGCYYVKRVKRTARKYLQ